MPKGKGSKGKSKASTPVRGSNFRRSVSIQQASNGFVISTITNKGEKIIIAKTKKTANRGADKLLGV